MKPMKLRMNRKENVAGAVGSYPGGGEWLITDVFFFYK